MLRNRKAAELLHAPGWAVQKATSHAATIKELEKLEPQFQRYDYILAALTNARRNFARHLRVNPTDPATDLMSSNKMRDIETPKGREGLEIFAPPPYRRGHDHNSFRPRFPALVPLICTL